MRYDSENSDRYRRETSNLIESEEINITQYFHLTTVVVISWYEKIDFVVHLRICICRQHFKLLQSEAVPLCTSLSQLQYFNLFWIYFLSKKLNICLLTFALCDESGFEDDICYSGGREVSCNANPNSRTGNRLAPGSTPDGEQVERRYNDLKGQRKLVIHPLGQGSAIWDPGIPDPWFFVKQSQSQILTINSKFQYLSRKSRKLQRRASIFLSAAAGLRSRGPSISLFWVSYVYQFCYAVKVLNFFGKSMNQSFVTNHLVVTCRPQFYGLTIM